MAGRKLFLLFIFIMYISFYLTLMKKSCFSIIFIIPMSCFPCHFLRPVSSFLQRTMSHPMANNQLDSVPQQSRDLNNPENSQYMTVTKPPPKHDSMWSTNTFYIPSRLYWKVDTYAHFESMSLISHNVNVPPCLQLFLSRDSNDTWGITTPGMSLIITCNLGSPTYLTHLFVKSSLEDPNHLRSSPRPLYTHFDPYDWLFAYNPRSEKRCVCTCVSCPLKFFSFTDLSYYKEGGSRERRRKNMLQIYFCHQLKQRLGFG